VSSGSRTRPDRFWLVLHPHPFTCKYINVIFSVLPCGLRAQPPNPAPLPRPRPQSADSRRRTASTASERHGAIRRWNVSQSAPEQSFKVGAGGIRSVKGLSNPDEVADPSRLGRALPSTAREPRGR
jgi:hypothetical protein